MSWSRQPIVNPIPKVIADQVQGIGLVASTLSVLLDAAAAALTVAKVFYQDTINVFRPIATALILALEQANNDLFGSGVYMLTVSGYDRAGGPIRDLPTVSDKLKFNATTTIEFGKIGEVGVKYDGQGIPLLTPKEAIELAVASFDDLGDVKRPIFSPTAYVNGFGFMLTAPDATALVALLKAFVAVFSIPDWKFMIKKLEQQIAASPPTVKSVRPDWTSLKLNQIDLLKQVQDTFNKGIALMRGYVAAADNNIQDLIDIIQAKADQLDRIAAQFNDLSNLLRNMSGVYVFRVDGVGGNDFVKQALRSCPLEKLNSGYTVMALFMGGGPSPAVIESIKVEAKRRPDTRTWDQIKAFAKQPDAALGENKKALFISQNLTKLML